MRSGKQWCAGVTISEYSDLTAAAAVRMWVWLDAGSRRVVCGVNNVAVGEEGRFTRWLRATGRIGAVELCRLELGPFPSSLGFMERLRLGTLQSLLVIEEPHDKDSTRTLHLGL